MSNPTFKTYELLQENVIRSIQEQTKDYSRTKIETAFVAAMEGENVVEVRLVDIVTKTLLKLQATNRGLRPYLKQILRNHGQNCWKIIGKKKLANIRYRRCCYVIYHQYSAD